MFQSESPRIPSSALVLVSSVWPSQFREIIPLGYITDSSGFASLKLQTLPLPSWHPGVKSKTIRSSPPQPQCLAQKFAVSYCVRLWSNNWQGGTLGKKALFDPWFEGAQSRFHFSNGKKRPGRKQGWATKTEGLLPVNKILPVRLWFPKVPQFSKQCH